VGQDDSIAAGPDKIARTVPVFVNGHSARELEYREKAVMAAMEKWGGYLDPEWNNEKVKAQIFMYQILVHGRDAEGHR